MLLIRTGSIEKIDVLVKQLGVNPFSLFEKVGWSPVMLRQPEALVSYQRLADLLDICADDCEDPVFGLRLTQLQGPLALGELLVASSQQGTIAEAISYTNQHMHLHARGVHLELVEFDERIGIALAFDFTNHSGLTQLIQLSLGQMYKSVALIVGGVNPALQIHIRQKVSKNYLQELADYKRVIGDNASFNGLSIPKSWLDKAIKRDNRGFEHYVNMRIQALEDLYPKDLESQVRYLCSNWMATGEATLEKIAAALGFHSRVLQLKLQKEGLSFRDLLLDVRSAKAQELLRIESLSVTDIALQLGYAESAVFCRNFKKWTGQTPLQWRRKNT